MALHVKTIGGHKYVYDVKSVRDKESKKVKKITTYMGPLLNAETKEYSPKKTSVVSAGRRQILHYGDTCLVWESLKQSEFFKIFNVILPDKQDTLNALICFKIIEGTASKNVQTWYEGNYASILFPQAQLDSQRISEIFTQLGDEKVQRKFFELYLTKIAEISGEIVIDSTGMPNEINIPLTECGNHGGGVEQETRLIMLIDRITHMPLYFRLVAGNIVDVSTLTTTLTLIKKFGVNPQIVIMDAGYYSEKNIRTLFKLQTSFLTRLPANRTLFKTLIEQTNTTLESAENAISYNKRSLFVQKLKTEICGYIGQAYICCDTRQRGEKMNKFIQDAIEDKLTNTEINDRMPFIGKFILVSDQDIAIQELLPLYYIRQVAENAFKFAKSTLNLLPLRVHSLETLRGYIFLSYIALLLSVKIQQKLSGLCSLQDALTLGHNHLCEVFDSNTVTLEPNKKMNELYDKLNIVVVNSPGV
jgi:hypothetical protein